MLVVRRQEGVDSSVHSQKTTRAHYLRVSAVILGTCIVGLICYSITRPPYFPTGTPENVRVAILDAYTTPITEFKSRRPGWAYVAYTAPMKELHSIGDDAVPAMIANLRTPELEFQFTQVLGDLQAEAAVPVLLDRLHMEDDFHDHLAIAKLADITEIPDGYRFYRTWFRKDVQEEAVTAYRAWCHDHADGLLTR